MSDTNALPTPFPLPTRLSDYVPHFDVAEQFPLKHRVFVSGECDELCYCAPSDAEGEYLLSSAKRSEQIRELLATQGKTVEMCGPCNTVIFAGNEAEKDEFWSQHDGCVWDYDKVEY
ncbi:hypothetical protein [Amycolatopsis anabasis]|uniref:hypothetical protein n=1 Tax=Amycolatopsis anabasis TaxID=1840409 RepID=UPI00131DC27E|nr:hypothetical protein [Amycolatopsis anabasis]